MTKFFIDLEFIEDGKTIDLIDIGIVTDDGREFYAINWSCDFEKASDWVAKNVLVNLPFRPIARPPSKSSDRGWYGSPGEIGKAVALFMGCEYLGLGKTPEWQLKEGVEEPIIWGEWCSYDWVCFAQMYGTMMDLPKKFPMRCRDVIQWAEDHLNIPYSDLPKSLEIDGNHNGLLGAKTVKARWEYCQRIQTEKFKQG